jgi:DNA-binding GntR family transcriptional regulator
MKKPSKRRTTRDGQSVDRIQRELRSRIARGLLLPGEQLRQEELALQLGVSRGPLREAFNILSAQGLLKHRSNQGYFVSRRAPEELFQLHLMLKVLETELLNTIIWPTKEKVSELRTLNRKMKSFIDATNWDEMLVLNRTFHFGIFGLSPHTLILQEVERLWSISEIYILNRHSLPESRRRSVAEHEKIIGTLVARDIKGCVLAHDIHRTSIL